MVRWHAIAVRPIGCRFRKKNQHPTAQRCVTNISSSFLAIEIGNRQKIEFVARAGIQSNNDSMGDKENCLATITSLNSDTRTSSECRLLVASAIATSILLLNAVGTSRGESAVSPSAGRELPSVQDMIEARSDVWGDAARAQPNGASYEFFEDLLPPLRWVNTDFRHYPLVLSAPRSPQKTRLISNGSAVNARANKPPMWYEQGAPVSFFVGESSEPFGRELTQLETPTWLDGYLPVVAIKYRHNGALYQEEAFAPVDDQAAAHGAAMLRFSIAEGNGRVAARIEAKTPLHAENGQVLDETGQCLVAFSPSWQWVAERHVLVTDLVAGRTAELAIFTKRSANVGSMSRAKFDHAKQQCIRAWNDLLERSVRLETPEPIVNNAWRAMLIGNFMMAVGNRPHYSAGNAYAKLYQGECGDTLRSFMLFGHLDIAPAMLRPMLEFNREATRFHVAGHKLQLLAYFYWITRETDVIRAYEPLWRPSVELILNSRAPDTGLLPKDNYAGDIKTQVYSLNSNANSWRGLRDVAAMLDDMGEPDEADKLRHEAAKFRSAILDAVARSERRDTEPPFIPIALLSDEPAHDPLTATQQGSYYDLMCPYVIGSEIFGQGSQREDWLLGYMQQHGAIAMGMIRTEQHQGQFKDEPGVCPLYGLRYQLALLRRDEREKALVGFYGQLAQGMTRGTFIGGEGSKFRHGDANGRSFYLPPNSTSSATWLLTLRNLLVQDWDLDEDARPDTLRLLFAAPRRWLADGQVIRIEDAPTQFGPVSCTVQSKLSDGYVEMEFAPPPRTTKLTLLRAPLPDGWQIKAVEIDGVPAPLIDGNTVDLSGRVKPITVRFMVDGT